MLRHRNFQSVIGPLTLEVAFYLIFFFKQKTAYEIGVRLVGSEMCIRDRNPNFYKRKIKAAFKGVERLFRIQSHFANFYVEPQHLND